MSLSGRKSETSSTASCEKLHALGKEYSKQMHVRYRHAEKTNSNRFMNCVWLVMLFCLLLLLAKYDMFKLIMFYPSHIH